MLELEDPIPPVAADPGLDPADLVGQLYAELRRMAAGCLLEEKPGHTLQPTALVHEAWMRLASVRQAWRTRSDFLAAASVAMRRVLVDSARRKQAAKRPPASGRITLANAELPSASADLVELDDLLSSLAQLDPRKSRVVEMRCFAGMSHEEIAQALGVARSTVAADWVVARAWLAARLRDRAS